VHPFLTTALAAFVGAVLGALAKQIFDYTAASRSQKAARRDIWEQILVQSITELADIACEYWGEELKDPVAAKHEGRIRGLIVSIDGANAQLFKERVKIKQDCDSSIHAVRRKATGGTFECAERSIDYNRVRDVQIACAELAAQIQSERAKLPLPIA
jgi:hypothetical protein